MSGAFRAAVERRDHAGMSAALHPDVVFRSPVTFQPFLGRDAASHLLGIVMEVFEGFRYTDELAGEGTAALVFEARVGTRDVQGVDLLWFDDEGLIREFAVMVRPLSAARALAEAVGARLGATGAG